MFDARFDPVSNREDWYQAFEIIDGTNEEIITDLTGVSVLVEFRRKGECVNRLRASTDDGTVVELGGGVLQWYFPRTSLASLEPDTYDIGVTIERDDITSQYIIGVLPIVDGIVSR